MYTKGTRFFWQKYQFWGQKFLPPKISNFVKLFFFFSPPSKHFGRVLAPMFDKFFFYWKLFWENLCIRRILWKKYFGARADVRAISPGEVSYCWKLPFFGVFLEIEKQNFCIILNCSMFIYHNFRIWWTWENNFTWFAYKRHKLWNFEKKNSKFWWKFCHFFLFFFGKKNARRVRADVQYIRFWKIMLRKNEISH